MSAANFADSLLSLTNWDPSLTLNKFRHTFTTTDSHKISFNTNSFYTSFLQTATNTDDDKFDDSYNDSEDVENPTQTHDALHDKDDFDEDSAWKNEEHDRDDEGRFSPASTGLPTVDSENTGSG